jgi:hypothetical protein
MKWLLSLYACVFVTVATASAQEGRSATIQDLYTNCQDDTPRAYWGWCMGYLLGVADSMVETREPKNQRICVKDYTGGMLRRIFINWAEKHPKRWQEDRWVGATAAFREAWPRK